MISTNKDFEGISSNGHPTTYYGLSTDSKPENKVINGACFIEMDTGGVYFFNKTANEWVKFGA